MYSLAGAQAGSFSYISEFHTQKRASFAASMVSVFMSGVWIYMSALAMFIIPMDWVLPIYTLQFKPWRLFLVCNAAVNFWNAIAFSYLPESPKFLVANNRKQEALHVLRRVYAINTGNSKNVSFAPLGKIGKFFMNLVYC